MNPGHSMRRIPLQLTTIALLLGTPMMLHAQDNPEEDEQTTEEQMLDDFGSGLRALGWALDDPDLDLKELWAVAADAVLPEKGDVGMEVYLDDYEANQQQGELEAFRGELKNSVMNGTMSRDEALSTWLEVMDVRFFHDFKDDKGTVWADRLEESAGMGQLSAIMLRIPGCR